MKKIVGLLTISFFILLPLDLEYSSKTQQHWPLILLFIMSGSILLLGGISIIRQLKDDLPVVDENSMIDKIKHNQEMAADHRQDSLHNLTGDGT